jgi:hypothetical protein
MTYFFEYQDTTRKAPEVCVTDPKYQEYLTNPESVNDLVIIPIDLDLRLDLSATNNGEGMFSSIKFKHRKSTLKFDECRFAYNINELGSPPKEETKKGGADDEEDFDDGEDVDLASIEGLEDLVNMVSGGG